MNRRKELRKFVSADVSKKVAEILVELNSAQKELPVETLARVVVKMRKLSDDEIQKLELATRPPKEKEFPCTPYTLEDRLKENLEKEKRASDSTLAKIGFVRYVLAYTMEKRGIERLKEGKGAFLAADGELEIAGEVIKVRYVKPDKSTAGRKDLLFKETYPALRRLKRISGKKDEKTGEYYEEVSVKPVKIVGCAMSRRAGMPPYLFGFKVEEDPQEPLALVSEKNIYADSRIWLKLLEEAKKAISPDDPLTLRQFAYEALKNKEVFMDSDKNRRLRTFTCLELPDKGTDARKIYEYYLGSKNRRKKIR